MYTSKYECRYDADGVDDDDDVFNGTAKVPHECVIPLVVISIKRRTGRDVASAELKWWSWLGDVITVWYGRQSFCKSCVMWTSPETKIDGVFLFDVELLLLWLALRMILYNCCWARGYWDHDSAIFPSGYRYGWNCIPDTKTWRWADCEFCTDCCNHSHCCGPNKSPSQSFWKNRSYQCVFHGVLCVRTSKTKTATVWLEYV